MTTGHFITSILLLPGVRQVFDTTQLLKQRDWLTLTVKVNSDGSWYHILRKL
jgi:hypothetical protein